MQLLKILIKSIMNFYFWVWGICIYLKYRYLHLVVIGKLSDKYKDPSKVFLLANRWINHIQYKLDQEHEKWYVRTSLRTGKTIQQLRKETERCL